MHGTCIEISFSNCLHNLLIILCDGSIIIELGLIDGLQSVFVVLPVIRCFVVE
jgi:hypothetical protein